MNKPYYQVMLKLQLYVLVYRQMRPVPLLLSCTASRGRGKLLKEIQKQLLMHLSHSKLMKRVVQWARAQRKGKACLSKVKKVPALPHSWSSCHRLYLLAALLVSMQTQSPLIFVSCRVNIPPAAAGYTCCTELQSAGALCTASAPLPP